MEAGEFTTFKRLPEKEGKEITHGIFSLKLPAEKMNCGKYLEVDKEKEKPQSQSFQLKPRIKLYLHMRQTTDSRLETGSFSNPCKEFLRMSNARRLRETPDPFWPSDHSRRATRFRRGMLAESEG